MWEVTFKKDPDKQDVGSITANYMNGEQIEFTYSRRIDGKNDAIAFVAEAKAAKLKAEADTTQNNKLATAIETKLNA